MAELQDRIVSWYEAHGRKELPWRNTNDMYHIWLSEIMLQQTQVKTVLERFYFPFLEQFPTIEALAHAPQDAVLKAWQGLGYYNRAINFHKAAQEIAAKRVNINPKSPDLPLELQKLSGIGKNTAHAIASFAYNAPFPVVEANVKRVLSRFYALKTPKDDDLWKKAASILNKEDPFTHNQAMMDIGSYICTKSNPKCGECPLSIECKGKSTPEIYPEKQVKKKVPVRTRTIIIEAYNNDYSLTPRTTRFLNGLYGFREVETYHKEAEDIYIGDISQSYSHFTLEASVYHRALEAKANDLRWFNVKELKKLPVSKADEKAIALLEKYLA